MKKFRFVIVGTGNIAADHIRALRSNPEVEVVGVCDSNPTRLAEFCQQHNCPGYNNVDELLEKAEFDAACICVPQMFRRNVCLPLLKAGKHLLVEKPFASSVTVGREMLETAKQSGVIIGGVSQRRFFEPVQRMYNAIASGKIIPKIGNIQIYGHRDRAYYDQLAWRGKRGDGLMFNQTAHQLDLLLSMMGPAKNVSGTTANHTHTYNEAEDYATAAIRFESGATANYFATLSMANEDAQYARVHIIGDNEQMIGVQTDRHMWVAGKSTKPASPPFNDVWTLPGGDLEAWQAEDLGPRDGKPSYHTLQISDFVSAIREGREPEVKGEDLQAVVELIAGIYLSSATGRRIKLPLSHDDAVLFDRWLAGSDIPDPDEWPSGSRSNLLEEANQH